jgi:hypothetical protein
MKSLSIGVVAAFALLILAILFMLTKMTGLTGDLQRDNKEKSAIRAKTTHQKGGISARPSTEDQPSELADLNRKENTEYPHQEAPVPVAFLVQEVDMNEFTAEENETIHRVQEQFAAELSGPISRDPGSDAYAKAWKKAQWRADNRLRLELGAVGFNRFNSLAAQQAELKRSSAER